MKILKVQLESPSQGFYSPGMTVQGTLTVENDSGPKEYNSIEVTLKGEAYVNLGSSQQRDTHQISPHEGHEVFFKVQSVLWDKDRDGSGGLYPSGTHKYNFSMDLAASNLPSTHDDARAGYTMGFIHYSVDATIHRKMGYLNITASTPITVKGTMPISDSALLQPCSKETETTICCLWCTSGPIFLKATVPRTGYCVTSNDAIPLEVYTDNSSHLKLQRLEAAIIKTVVYRSSRGLAQFHSAQVASVASEQSVPSNSSLTWKPDALNIPNVEITLENSLCSLITVTYLLKVCAVNLLHSDIFINIPIVLGNVPFNSRYVEAPDPILPLGSTAMPGPVPAPRSGTMPPRSGPVPAPRSGPKPPPRSNSMPPEPVPKLPPKSGSMPPEPGPKPQPKSGSVPPEPGPKPQPKSGSVPPEPGPKPQPKPDSMPPEPGPKPQPKPELGPKPKPKPDSMPPEPGPKPQPRSPR